LTVARDQVLRHQKETAQAFERAALVPAMHGWKYLECPRVRGHCPRDIRTESPPRRARWIGDDDIVHHSALPESVPGGEVVVVTITQTRIDVASASVLAVAEENQRGGQVALALTELSG